MPRGYREKRKERGHGDRRRDLEQERRGTAGSGRSSAALEEGSGEVAGSGIDPKEEDRGGDGAEENEGGTGGWWLAVGDPDGD